MTDDADSFFATQRLADKDLCNAARTLFDHMTPQLVLAYNEGYSALEFIANSENDHLFEKTAELFLVPNGLWLSIFPEPSDDQASRFYVCWHAKNGKRPPYKLFQGKNGRDHKTMATLLCE